MLTDRTIQAAIKNCTKETTLNDGAAGRGTGSLRLRIRPTTSGASANWIGFWKRDGQRVTKPLGRYPDLTLAAAREAFSLEVRGVLQAGRNPRAAVPKTNKPTVQALFEAYLASLRLGGTRTADEIERTLLTGKYNAADGLGRTRMAGEIDPSDVSAFLAKGFERGARRQTDLCRTFMHAAFNWGMKSTHDYRSDNRRDWGIKSNPVAAVPKDTEANKTRDRNLTAEEIRAVWHTAKDQTGDLLRLVIACGQRVLETQRVDGADVDLAARLWTMPAHKTKGGKRPHVIPLPDQAVEIFRQLIALHGDGPLFPARGDAKGERITVASISRAATRLTCCAPFQPRDLRRTWKSRAGEAGVDRFMRDMIQQHAQGDTGTKHYDRSDYLPQMREAMDKWQAWLAQALA